MYIFFLFSKFQFTNEIQKLIVECENLEERVCVIHRSLEILVVLQELHNFNGVFAMNAALTSAAVNRIVQNVKDKLPNNLLKALSEASKLIDNHSELYWEKLRSINPPCVPFYGLYQTKIVHSYEGMKDFLPDHPNLINFNKRRKVADIISEIQQYQNQPYCLNKCAEIRAFLENLKPFPDLKYDDDKHINDYLWQKSNEVEPKDVSKRKLVSFS